MSKLKVDEIRSADRSVSDSANITLADDGNTSLGGTLSAGTIGNNVTIQSSFGVTDRSSIFVAQTGWTINDIKAYSFNGFMFFTSNFQHNGGLPTSGENIWEIENANSAYRPIFQVDFPVVSYEGDLASAIRFSTNGAVTCQYPKEGGSNNNWYAVINGWYRFA